MFSYTVTPITAHIIQLMDATGVSSFLITGQTKALLVDACTGIGDLKGEVARLTGLPLDLLLTHGHADHTGAASQFDCVYMRQEDIPLMKEHDLQNRLGYVRMFTHREPSVDAAELTPDMVSPPRDIAPGHIFDLGGVTVEIIAVPGHTKGMVCPLIREDRTILFGDACNGNTLILEGGLKTIETYKQSLLALKQRQSDFDTVLYSHGPAIGPSCLDGNLELCDRILSGTDDAVPTEFLGMTMYRAAAMDEHFQRLDGGFGNIAYIR